MKIIPRHALKRLERLWGAFPAVAVTGARQVGKSTLVLEFIKKHPRIKYYSLDDRATLDAATADPDGFLSRLDVPVAIDEVQRVPDLMRAIKVIVDRNRRPGMFLLTGSAHLLSLRRLSETLAGRMAILELLPFSLSEIEIKPPPDILKALFGKNPSPYLLNLSGRGKRNLDEQILRGMMPIPAFMKDAGLRLAWFESYRQTYTERDLRDLSQIENLPAFSRLVTMSALRTGQVINLAGLARDLAVSPVMVRRYLDLLELTCQVNLLAPFFINIGKRLVKSAKLYMMDTGMAAAIIGVNDWKTGERLGYTGQLLETWAYQELRKLALLSESPTRIYFWRTHAGAEIDFVLEQGAKLVAIEVKTTVKISSRDIRSLKQFFHDFKTRANAAVIIYGGTEVVPLAERIWAVPIAQFFSTA